MRLIKTNLIVPLVSCMFIFGLGIVGCEGPAGPEGAQGQQGEVGPIGPAGKDGSVMHAGEGAPAADLGKLGDFYLNTNNAALYGPKTADGWGVPISLKGPKGDDGEDGKDGKDGEDGEDGSRILSGTSPPDGSLGQPDDFYLNKSTFDFYGPKTGSGWGTPINLQATTNVMYSVWMDITWNDFDTQFTKSMEIPESRITKEFLNSGGNVLMYLKVETMGVFLVLPLPILDSNDLLQFFAGLQPSPNEFQGVVLVQESVDGMTPLSIDYTKPEYKIRYVLIPGSEAISAKEPGENPPVDLENYGQVKKYFGIRDLKRKTN